MSLPIGYGKIKCKNCNHEICGHCGNWCDNLAWTDEEIKERGIFEEKDHDNVHVMGKSESDRFPVLCCGGCCVYV